MRIITDFDGVIVDLADRYYHVYLLRLDRVRLPGQSVRVLTKAEFWALKRQQVQDLQFAIESGLTIAQAETFVGLRDRHAHQLEYLHLDRLIPSAIAALEQIQSNGIELVLMTMRRTCELNVAFDRYNLGRFFPHPYCYCLSDTHHKQGDIQDKTNLMTIALTDLGTDESTWMVGDTEADILSAQAHQIKVIGVLSGIRDRNRLEQYRPKAIVPNLAAAVELILSSETTHHP
jgi:phosphoglycolate phosphatase-like HAD superfamily hydrolase